MRNSNALKKRNNFFQRIHNGRKINSRLAEGKWRLPRRSNSHYDLVGRTVLGEPAKSIRQLLLVRLTEDGSPYLATGQLNDRNSK